MKITKNHAFTLIELLVVIAIIAVLASIAIPVYGEAQAKAQRTKCLSQAKGIFPALKMFAGDYDSGYPSLENQGGQNPGGPCKDANTAYANLIPNYLSNESPFGNSSSRYCKDGTTNQYIGPDNDISSQEKILAAGENAYAYIMGLNETSNSSYPIVVDAFAQGSESDPKYSKTENDYGAQWKGRYAIVIRCDGSGTVENVKTNSLKVERKGQGAKNLFAVSSDPSDPWLVGCTVLNPKIK
jgi:prepilin-type N-terminal cleavage/methylation domain-containing protein